MKIYYNWIFFLSAAVAIVSTSNPLYAQTVELTINSETSDLSVPEGYTSYQWYRNESAIDGQTTNNLFVDDHGEYFAILDDGLDSEIFSDTLSIPEIIIEEVQTLGTSCNGGHGAIRVLPLEFFQEFQYALDEQAFQSDNHFYGISDGNYEVKVRSKLLYAYGIESQATIDTRPAVELYDETFDDQPLLRLGNPDQNVGWRLTSTGYDADGGLFLNFFNYSSIGQQDYYILSNTFSSNDQLNLSFAYAYAKYEGDLTLNDSLAVVQSFDCGATWQTLVQRGGDELTTAEPDVSFFEPESQEDWAMRSVLIEPSEDEFLLAFKSINGYGNTLYLDSISLSIHENQPPVFDPLNLEIEENSFGEFTLQAFDFEGEELTFSILTDSIRESNDIFFGTSGNFLYNEGFLNYEADSLVQFVAHVEDESQNVDTALVTIKVIDVNDQPVSEDYPEYFVNELSVGGTEAGLVEVFDEEDDPITFKMEYSTSEDSLFVIDSITGMISVHPDSTLESAENREYYDLTVIFSDVSDEEFYTYPRVYLVELSPLVVADTLSVFENESIGTLVGNLDITNLSAAEVTLSIAYGNNGNAFEIDNSGLITVNNSLAIDFESIPYFVLGINASSEFGSNTTLVVIDVEDIDDDVSSGGCRLTKYSEQYADGNTKNINTEFYYLGENLVTVIDTVEHTYASFEYNDNNQIISGFISSFREGPFSIIYEGDLLSEFVWDVSGNSGEYDVMKIKYFYENDTVVRIDRRSYISPTQYYLDFKWTFEWRDGQILQGTFKEIGDEQEFIVYQFDERDNPFFGLDPYFFITHFDPVHTLSKNNLLAYSGDETYVYEYEYDSNLPVGGGYVENNAVATNFTFEYEGCGLGNTIPTISNHNFSINENTIAATVVGTILATDPDGDELSFSILSGNTNNAFALSATGELTVETSSELDFETTHAFTLEVEVNDGNGGTDSGTVTVNLIDLNENPVVENQTFSIDENSPDDTIVGIIEATDQDSDALSFVVESSTNSAFDVHVTTGEVTVLNAELLNFEVLSHIEINVSVSDGNGGVATALITVGVNDINDLPGITNQTFSITEGQLAGTIGNVLASDEDGDALSFSIISGNDEEAFSISETGALSLVSEASLTFGADSQADLEVEVNDGNGGAANATITIELNEKPLSNDVEEGIHIFPNPASNLLRVELAADYIDSILEIRDASGKRMIRRRVKEHSSAINISSLKSGMYFLILSNRTIKFTKAD
ncbi:MAG: cadherin domain-containing protein [Cyclobacteriaceae bacterium]